MLSFGQIILASESPRRQALLHQIGMDFTVKISGIDEDISIDLPPNQLAEHFAREKAHAVALNYPNQLVIGADTIVVFDGQIFGKPKDYKDSFDMLSTLSGNTHQVITGVTLKLLDKNLDETFHEVTNVTFNTLSEIDINYYIDTYNPFDKAGRLFTSPILFFLGIQIAAYLFNLHSFSENRCSHPLGAMNLSVRK